jgi:hypothetical protein
MAQTADFNRADAQTDDQTDDIFLSPRVIDMKSFKDLEGRLRKLIAHALESGKALVNLDEKAQGSLAALEQAEPLIEERTQAAARLLTSLGERVGSAEALLAKAIARAERVEHLEDEIERIIGGAEQAMKRRLDAVVADAERRLRAVESDLATRAADHAASLKGVVEAAATDAKVGSERCAASLADAQRAADASADQLTERMESLRRDAGNLRTPMLELLSELCGRATALLGRDLGAPDDAAPTPGSMADIVDKGERLRNDTQLAIRQLEHVRGQTDQARKLLGESLLKAAKGIDELGERQKALEASIRGTTALCDAARGSMERQERELRDAMARPLRHANEEAERLSGLMTQAEATRRDASGALARHADVLARIEGALAKLEPWQAALIEGKDDLPPALAQIVSMFRAELGEDISRLADGLHAVARRADDASAGIRQQA